MTKLFAIAPEFSDHTQSSVEVTILQHSPRIYFWVFQTIPNPFRVLLRVDTEIDTELVIMLYDMTELIE